MGSRVGRAEGTWTAAERTAFIAAIGSAGGTFAPGLLPRSGRDQAIATGLVTAVNHSMVAAAQSVLLSVATSRRCRCAVELAGLTAGLAAWRFGGAAGAAGTTSATGAPEAVRALGPRITRTCIIGLLATAAEDLPGGGWWSPAGRPVAAVAGTAIAGTALHRQRGIGRSATSARDRLRSVATGGAVSVTLLAAGRLERAAAQWLAMLACRALPPTLSGRALGLVIGRGVVLAATAATAHRYLHRAALRVQASNAGIDSAYRDAPSASTVSGGPASRVPYATLGREGSRFIQSITGPAPIRAYVGLASAATPEERVELALAELDALGGFDRSVLCVAVPAGSGYVNSVAIGAVEHLTGGDCATVAIQYSLRRSYQSMRRVPMSADQNRLLLAGLARRLGELPASRRPTLLLYGESLGALAAQDSFAADGIAALDGLGIERALFAGTPSKSAWARRWRAGDGRDEPIVEIASHEDWAALPDDRRAGVRAVLLSHHDDPVTVFDRGLLVRRARGRPGFRPLTTFTLTALDLKNAMNSDPTQFTTLGHDYRGDLVRVIAVAYRLGGDDESFERIERALLAANADQARITAGQ